MLERSHWAYGPSVYFLCVVAAVGVGLSPRQIAHRQPCAQGVSSKALFISKASVVAAAVVYRGNSTLERRLSLHTADRKLASPCQRLAKALS